MKWLGWTLSSQRLQIIGLCVVALVAFHVAYATESLGWVIGIYLLCLFRLAWVETTRMAFWLGLGIGLATVGPQLGFFWGLFGPMAVALWLVLAFWIGIFLLVARLCVGRFGDRWAMVLMPVVWVGLEYFRGELYPLRFTWLSAGLAVGGWGMVRWVGVYGVGFLVMAVVGVLHMVPRRVGLGLGVMLVLVIVMQAFERSPIGPPRPSRLNVDGASVTVVGIQTEGLGLQEILRLLDVAIEKYPYGDLFVLSEYAFGEPVPKNVREWCARHGKYLIAGGMEDAEPTFRNTAYVVGPEGEIVFSQGKRVPIQFMRDGLAAERQALWQSPWGKIGICVCYDLSYVRVVDRLVGMGAEALIVPTMDVVAWGKREHELHGRIGPARAAEYGIPVVRAASSGISQIVAADGRVVASAGFPGIGEIYVGEMVMGGRGRLPLDRWFGPVCVGGVVVVMLGLIVTSFSDGRVLVVRRGPSIQGSLAMASRRPTGT